jgi:hypothetical protein
MSSKPKKQDYQASEAEKASAGVATAEYEYFKQKYDPLLQEMRDKSMNEDIRSTLRGRANADTMQQLSAPSYERATSATVAGDTAAALGGQMNEANMVANKASNEQRLGVLGAARGQMATAQDGMATASRLATSSALERARANQQVAEAKQAAAVQVASTFAFQGMENKATRGIGPDGQEVKGTFFSPVRADGSKVSGFGGRLSYSTFGDMSRPVAARPNPLMDPNAVAPNVKGPR